MHRLKKSKWSQTISILTLTSLTLGSIALAPSANAQLYAPEMDFYSSSDITSLTAGDPAVTFDNVISGQNLRAKVQVMDVQNACSSEFRLTSPKWELNWDEFGSNSTAGHGHRIQYSFRGGDPIYLPALDQAAFSFSVLDASLNGLTQTNDREEYEFVVLRFADANPGHFAEDAINSEILDASSSTRLNRAFHGDYLCEGNISRLSRLDSEGLDPLEANHRLLEVSVSKSNRSQIASATIKVSFEDSDTASRAVLNYLSLNVYDLDNTQYLIASNVDSYQLTSDTIINRVTKRGNNWRFDSADQETTGQDEFTKSRLQINFQNVSEVTITLGLPVGESTASFDLDFSDGESAVGAAWTIGSGPEPRTYFTRAQSSGGSSAAALQHFSTQPLAPTSKTKTVTMFGNFFDKVTAVYVAGKKVKILEKSAGQLKIRLPKGLKGAVDVELRSPLGNLLLPKHLSFPGSSETRRAAVVVGGFDHNSRVLTTKMKKRIDRWLAKYPDLKTVTCTGYTSLPKRTSDVRLSRNRGITACNYAKSKRLDLVTRVTRGIEDPRPGLNVRRVRLVLTP